MVKSRGVEEESHKSGDGVVDQGLFMGPCVGNVDLTSCFHREHKSSKVLEIETKRTLLHGAIFVRFRLGNPDLAVIRLAHFSQRPAVPCVAFRNFNAIFLDRLAVSTHS